MEQAAGRDNIPRTGEVLAGKYEVNGTLGVGTMGVVLSANRIDRGLPVAIKLLRPEALSNPEAIARFLREARASARLTSDHVVRIYGAGRTARGMPYLVMERLSGSTLAELLRERGALPIAEAMSYLLQAAEAIAEAHSLGIVHRDLKPKNMFLTRREDGSALIKVLDFGISKLLEPGAASSHDRQLTSNTSLLGSPVYMSPEQIQRPKSVDARTDIWALGVCAYELITAARPFEAGNLAACFAKIVHEPPAPLRERRPDVPVELEAAIMRCLEKDMDNRFRDINELAQTLSPFATERSRASLARISRLSLDVVFPPDSNPPISMLDPISSIDLLEREGAEEKTVSRRLPATPRTRTAGLWIWVLAAALVLGALFAFLALTT